MSVADRMSYTDKILFVLTMFRAELSIAYNFLFKETKYENQLKTAVIITLMSLPMAYNFSTGKMISETAWDFDFFQYDSERLVAPEILWNDNNKKLDNKYGLHSYLSIFADQCLMIYQNGQGITVGDFDCGYSKELPGTFILVNSDFTKDVLDTAETVAFSDGIDYKITDKKYSDDKNYIVVYTDCGVLLNTENSGNLRYAVFKNSAGERIDTETAYGYYSQYGLQGKFFGLLSKAFTENAMMLAVFHNFCAVMLAVVLATISFEVAFKYNKMFGLIFYITFGLSPWIANFAKNLYWVEFTWFVPILICLAVSNRLENRNIRTAAYISMFFAVFIKCLCGYEYITTILVASMTFLATDLICAVAEKNKEKSKLIFKTTCILSAVALCGFFVAILLHANIKGDGNIIEGIIKIWKNDVMRRTIGNPNDFTDEWLQRSLTASILITVRRYFIFSTEIIFGIDGKLFLPIAIAPIIIFEYESIVCKKTDTKNICLYLLFFASTLSWFVLAKGHSYIHIHMNYVLWYFGFIQICIYIISDRIINFIRKGDKIVELR